MIYPTKPISIKLQQDIDKLSLAFPDIEWREVVPDYYVSSYGHVFSLKKKGKLLTPRLGFGYVLISIIIPVEGTTKYVGRFVHRLVAQAFLPNPDNLPQINHKDGNKENNHYSNLEWCTARHNIRHSFANGMRTIPVGEECNSAKLTRQDVINIRKEYVRGSRTKGLSALARKYGVVTSSVWDILYRRSWKHVP